MSPRESNRRPPESPAAIWWLHPFWIVVAPLLAMSLGAFLISEPDYQENWRTAKAFGAMDLVLCFSVAAAFSAGCLLAWCLECGFCHHRRLAPGPRDVRTGQWELKLLFDVVYLVTIIGYAIWFGSILRQGGIGMFTSVLTGGAWATDDLKKIGADSMITGITTFTQFGMGTALLGTYLGFTQGWRRVRVRLVLLLLVTAVRAVFLSERLSLLEVVLPSVVLLIRLAGFGPPRSVLRRFLLVAPLAGIAGLYALFTFTEFFRSWSAFYGGRGDQSLFSFSLLRLLGYYVTALNNGAIEWHEHGALYFPYSTMDWLWKFPVIGSTLHDFLGGKSDPTGVRIVLLQAAGNPEFNNTSGIFVVFTDLGVPGALLGFAFFGCVAALLHGSYRRGSVVGLFLYSFLFVGLSEQVRIFYVSAGRAFPTWLLLLLAVLVSSSRPRRAGSIPARSGSPP